MFGKIILTRRGVRHRVRQRRAATAADVNWGKRACWRARLGNFRNGDFGKSVMVVLEAKVTSGVNVVNGYIGILPVETRTARKKTNDRVGYKPRGGLRE